MKKLIIINGTMGVGKTTVCRELQKLLTPCVFLDGDWCWDMNPFVVNEENKAMALDNIGALLRSFLANSGFEYVIFCWVIHMPEIFTEILDRLDGSEYELHRITLTCSEAALSARIARDISRGVRKPGDIERSAARLPLYENMETTKLDVGGISPQQAAERIVRIISA